MSSNKSWVVAAFTLGALVGFVANYWRTATPDGHASRSIPTQILHEAGAEEAELDRLQVDTMTRVAVQDPLPVGSSPAMTATSAITASMLAEPRVSRLMESVSYYEKSPEYNPHGLVLSDEQRNRLNRSLRELDIRAEEVRWQLNQEAKSAARDLRAAGKARRADAQGVRATHGAVAMDLRVGADAAATVVDLYEQDLPGAPQLRAEVDALREQGLALVRDYFQSR